MFDQAQLRKGTLEGCILKIIAREATYGYAIATDTGGALLNGSCLVDLFYETYSEALMNGVQQVNVYVVG